MIISVMLDLGWLSTTLSMIGKLFITAAFSSIYQYTAELFPTPVRQIVMGAGSTISSMSGMIAPFMGNVMVRMLFS